MFTCRMFSLILCQFSFIYVLLISENFVIKDIILILLCLDMFMHNRLLTIIFSMLKYVLISKTTLQ